MYWHLWIGDRVVDDPKPQYSGKLVSQARNFILERAQPKEKRLRFFIDDFTTIGEREATSPPCAQPKPKALLQPLNVKAHS